MPRPPTPAELRARLDRDLADGKTVVLSARELEDPMVRSQLPNMLEDLSRHHQRTTPDLQLPGYTLLGEIGQGGMSTVYLARHERLQRYAAVKVAPAWLGGGERASSALVQEAQTLARLKHPHIVSVYDILEVDNSFAIAMEWVDGQTLAALLRSLPESPGPDDMPTLAHALGADEAQREQLEEDITRFLVTRLCDIARATQAVHDSGNLHLDIKPSNVLLRRDGTALLADFGVTRQIDRDGNVTRTFAGTPAYSSPEQLRRRDELIGPPADVYGLGITLYEALARRQPLADKDHTGIVETVEGERIPPLARLGTVPPDLANIVHKAIAATPEHRYQTAAAFADDLDAFLAGRPVSARPLGTMQRLRRWVRRERSKVALWTALLVLIPSLGVTTGLLASWLPDIESAEQQLAREAAAELRTVACIDWFLRRSSADRALTLLEEAVAQDPSHASLATMIAYACEATPAEVTAIRDRYANEIAASTALQSCLARHDAGRSFFTDAEAARLFASTDDDTLYVLALDRLFRAEDQGTEEAYALAARAFDRLAGIRPDDPLPAALRVWTHFRSEQPDTGQTTIQVIEERWSKTPAILEFAAMAIEPFDAEHAERLLQQIVMQTPEQLRGYRALAGLYRRAFGGDRIDEIDALIERCLAAGLDPQPLRWEQLRDRCRRSSDADAARQLLAEVPPDEFGLRTRLRLRSLAEPDALLSDFEQTLDADDASAEHLEAIYHVCRAIINRDNRTRIAPLITHAWECFREHFPDRRKLHIDHFAMLFRGRNRNNVAEATQLARETMIPRNGIDLLSGVMIRALLLEHDWQHILRHARRWTEHGERQSQEAAFYHGLSAARLDLYEEAAKQLSAAIAVPSNDEWYAYALLEHAALHAIPDQAPKLANPELAQLGLKRFDAINRAASQPPEGPWTSLIRARVQLANGDRESAMKVACDGLRFGDQLEPLAPRDATEQLVKMIEKL